jgi:hypothetical protein
MNTAATLRAPGVHPAEPLASWYMPGMIDGFGDRLVMMDNAASDALELLRFRPTLVAIPGFEEALHDRVQQLRRLSHPAFPTVRGVQRLESDGSLVLVSTSTAGQRLSDFLSEQHPGRALHEAFVIWILSQAVASIAVLHARGEAVAHSALTADRIVLALDRRVRVVEHVLGAALRQLDCSPVRLWREFGILVPSDEAKRPQLDARGDVFQLGVLALSMLLARRLTRDDVDHRLRSLLDEWSAGSRSPSSGEPLRLWLERALQMRDRPYQSAAEAHADLRELPAISASTAWDALKRGPESEPPLRLISQSSTHTSLQEPGSAKASSMNAGLVSDEPPGAEPAVPAGAEATGRFGAPTHAAENPGVASRSRALRVAIVIVVVTAVVEGVVIARLLVQQRHEPAPRQAAALSLPIEVPRGVVPEAANRPSVRLTAPASSRHRPTLDHAGTSPAAQAPRDVAGRTLDTTAADQALAARNQRLGGVRLSAPIALSVLQGDRVLGSSADGLIATSAGTHDLDLTNASLGFRTRRTVTFRAGEITSLSIAVPPGRLNVNAVPWAEVWIDGRSAGETPLGNLTVPIGQHELVFRHPDLGERRQTVLVRADSVTRVSTTFDR